MQEFDHLLNLVDLDEERDNLYCKLQKAVKRCNRQLQNDLEAVRNGTDKERERFYQFSRMYVAITEVYEDDERLAYDSYDFEKMKSLHRAKLGRIYDLMRYYRINGEI